MALFKRELMSRLERIAVTIEHYLYRKLPSGDVATDTWYREMVKQVAATFREQKKWILSPKPDTRDQFIRCLADSLVCVASGNWDGLERTEPQKFSVPKLWRSRVVILLRTLLIGSAPLSVLWVVQQTPLALKEPTSQYVAIGGLIWAMLTLIAALDPLFRDKIIALKDVVQLLSPPKT